MQVLIAYAFDRSAVDVSSRLGRVADHYGQLWRAPVIRRGLDVDRIGLHVWDAEDSSSRWPVWQQDASLGVATLYHPIGYERVIAHRSTDRPALALARSLLDRPEGVSELTAPFVVATIEPDEGTLTLVTDALGLGRLYQLRYPGGWVWSNRPVAACQFAGGALAADRTGWRTFAAVGRFLGNHTPLENVSAVPAGSQVGYQTPGPGRTERRVNVLASWAANRRGGVLADDRLDEVAEALRGSARSVSRMWSGGITVDLSGGRDSRLVAAAFLSAGVDVQLYTNADEPGEGRIARRLVDALPLRVRHLVDLDAWTSPEERPGPLERASGWHRCQEGLRPATYLPARPPDGFTTRHDISVGGVGGEIARGYLYPSQFNGSKTRGSDALLRTYIAHLQGKVVRRPGVSPQAREDAMWHLRGALLDAAAIGLDDAKALDYFYVAERVRRGGIAAEGHIVSPLLVPEFVRAAFDLTPQQGRDGALHTALLARLMPSWADLPYYVRPAGLVQPAWQPRLGRAPDVDLISSLVADPEAWGDGFQVEFVQKEWRRLRAGTAGKQAEQLLQRVIWRATFDDYVSEVNGHELPERVAPKPPSRGASLRRLPVRGRRLTARALAKGARVVAPRPVSASARQEGP